MEKDPVCGMKVLKDETPFALELEGDTYFFCSEVCRKEFEEHSEEYLQKPAS